MSHNTIFPPIAYYPESSTSQTDYADIQQALTLGFIKAVGDLKDPEREALLKQVNEVVIDHWDTGVCLLKRGEASPMTRQLSPSQLATLKSSPENRSLIAEKIGVIWAQQAPSYVFNVNGSGIASELEVQTLLANRQFLANFNTSPEDVISIYRVYRPVDVPVRAVIQVSILSTKIRPDFSSQDCDCLMAALRARVQPIAKQEKELLERISAIFVNAALSPEVPNEDREFLLSQLDLARQEIRVMVHHLGDLREALVQGATHLEEAMGIPLLPTDLAEVVLEVPLTD